MWNSCYFYSIICQKMEALLFNGEHPAKVDDKGRVVLPSPFKKQMEKAGKDRFIARKGFHHNCIVLYTPEEWYRLHQDLSVKTDPFNPVHKNIMRAKNKSVFEVTIAENGRMLIPRRFLDLIGIKKDVIIVGEFETIEIWDMEQYDQIDDNNIDFSIIRNQDETPQ
jgi:MraZ protein